MATSKKNPQAAAKARPKKRTPNKQEVPAKTEKERAQRTARITLMPSANAAAVIADYCKSFGEQDIVELVEELRSQFDLVHKGDLSLCESMLMGQANTLQSIFVNLARRAVNQEFMTQYETFLKLALKAQNQSRMTLETLATLKNPPVLIAKQANINQGSGNQQVNNGTPAPVSHAEKTINQQNELLTEGVQNGTTLDNRGTRSAIGANQELEAVETIQRA